MQALYSTLPTDVIALKRASVLSLSITLGTYQQIRESIIDAAKRCESRMACFANVHMTVDASNQPAFSHVVNKADWVVADGLPLTWALRRQQQVCQERVAGTDMLPDVLQRAAEEKLPVFFYGSTPDVLASVTAVCEHRFPGLQIAGTLAPPFRPLTPREEDDVVAQINGSGARLVFVALGCPKQECWMGKMRGRVQAVMLGIGGALPILAGVQRRAPRWMQRNGLEWAYRLVLEPRRLFRRYTITNSVFMLRVFGQPVRRH